MDPRLKNPVTVLIAGPSGSGKTSLLMRILRHSKDMFEEPPTKIVWCYGVYQDGYNVMQAEFPTMTFVEGLPDSLDNYFDNGQPGCLILDDLMFSGTKSEDIAKVFTLGAHHKKIACFLITQNIFSSSGYMRTISLNCRYIILMRNNRDKLQIVNLAKQMFPGNSQYLCQAYEDSINLSKFGYLFLDLNHDQHCMRVRTQIFPDELHYVYVMKK